MICLPYQCFPAPIPLTPPSRREGGTLGYFMQGASPLASPRLNGARHWLSLPYRCPGAEPGRHRNKVARSASGGGACPCRSCFACRIIAFSPPSPQPPSRREGGTLGYFMQGASPLASPRLDGARHWLSLPYRCLDGRRNHSQGTLFVGSAETYRFSRRGSGGEAPGKIN